MFVWEAIHGNIVACFHLPLKAPHINDAFSRNGFMYFVQEAWTETYIYRNICREMPFVCTQTESKERERQKERFVSYHRSKRNFKLDLAGERKVSTMLKCGVYVFDFYPTSDLKPKRARLHAKESVCFVGFSVHKFIYMHAVLVRKPWQRDIRLATSSSIR